MSTTINEMIAASEHTKLMLKMRTVLIYFVPTLIGKTPGAEILALTGPTGGFLPVPADYQAGAVGLIDKGAGVEFPRDVSTQEATSYNHGGPTRVDTEEDKKGVKFTAQETRRQVLEMAYGIDLSNVVQQANGEVVIDHPELPDDLEGRLLVIGHDPKYQIAMGKWFPRFQPKDFPTVSWKRDEVVTYEIAGDALYDEEFGISVREFIAGPGAKAMADAIGFKGTVTP